MPVGASALMVDTEPGLPLSGNNPEIFAIA
jgi:hypothetical protein